MAVPYSPIILMIFLENSFEKGFSIGKIQTQIITPLTIIVRLIWKPVNRFAKRVT